MVSRLEKLNALIDSASDKGDPDVYLDEKAYKAKSNELENRNTEQNINLRRKFSWAIYGFVVVFVCVILVILICCGLGWLILSDSILLALVTTMTTTIVGLLVFVLKYFFPNAHGNGN